MEGSQGSSYNISNNFYTSSQLHISSDSKLNNLSEANSSLARKVDGFAEPLFSQINDDQNHDLNVKFQIRNDGNSSDNLIIDEVNDISSEEDDLSQYLTEEDEVFNELEEIPDIMEIMGKMESEVDLLESKKNDLKSFVNNNISDDLSKKLEFDIKNSNYLESKKNIKNIVSAVNEVMHKKEAENLKDVFAITKKDGNQFFLKQIDVNNSNEMKKVLISGEFVEVKNGIIYINDKFKSKFSDENQIVNIFDVNNKLVEKKVCRVESFSNDRLNEIRKSLFVCIKYSESLKENDKNDKKIQSHTNIDKSDIKVVHRLSKISLKSNVEKSKKIKKILDKMVVLNSIIQESLDKAEKKKEELLHDKRQRILKKDILEYNMENDIKNKS